MGERVMEFMSILAMVFAVTMAILYFNKKVFGKESSAQKVEETKFFKDLRDEVSRASGYFKNLESRTNNLSKNLDHKTGELEKEIAALRKALSDQANEADRLSEFVAKIDRSLDQEAREIAQIRKALSHTQQSLPSKIKVELEEMAKPLLVKLIQEPRVDVITRKIIKPKRNKRGDRVYDTYIREYPADYFEQENIDKRRRTKPLREAQKEVVRAGL